MCTVVDHSLLGEYHEEPVHLEHPHPRCYHHGHLTGAVKVTVDVVFIKHCNRNRADNKHGAMERYIVLFCLFTRQTIKGQVDSFQVISLSRSGVLSTRKSIWRKRNVSIGFDFSK